MNNKGQSRTIISRRAVVAGAAAGAAALASAPASAQRCPATPPPRTKGPLVWMNMDQHELDEAYDQSVYAFNQRFVQERRDERNQLMARSSASRIASPTARAIKRRWTFTRPSGRTRR